MTREALSKPHIIKLLLSLKKNDLESFLKLIAPMYIDNDTNCWFRADDWSVYSTVEGKRAHRLSYELFTGFTIGINKFICHKCDRPGCFNPEHLFEGTASDNKKDAMNKGRMYGIKLGKKVKVHQPMPDLTYLTLMEHHTNPIKRQQTKTIISDDLITLDLLKLTEF